MTLDATFALAVAAIVLAGVVRGFSGFGAAMIAVPALSILFSPVVAVPVMVLTDSACTLPMVVKAVRRCAWREVLPLALASAVMVPVGVQLLIHLDAGTLKVAMGVLVLAVTAVMALGWRYSGPVRLPVTLATGASAGFLGGSVGIAGPPVILFWLAGQGDAVRVRANLITFFGCGSVASVATLWLAGLFTREVLILSLLLAPTYALALYLGERAFGLTTERLFRRAALTIVGGMGLSAMIAGLTTGPAV